MAVRLTRDELIDLDIPNVRVALTIREAGIRFAAVSRDAQLRKCIQTLRDEAADLRASDNLEQAEILARIADEWELMLEVKDVAL